MLQLKNNTMYMEDKIILYRLINKTYYVSLLNILERVYNFEFINTKIRKEKIVDLYINNNFLVSIKLINHISIYEVNEYYRNQIFINTKYIEKYLNIILNSLEIMKAGNYENFE